MEDDNLLDIIEKNRGIHGELLSILQEIQDRHGYLPRDILQSLSHETGYSLVDIYGVATFYKSFRLKPKGRHVITVCRGTACHVRGSKMIAEELEKRLKVKSGETTEDGEYTLEHVNCLGTCALGPIVVLDENYFSNVRAADVSNLLMRDPAGSIRADSGSGGASHIVILAKCPRCGKSFMDAGHSVDGLDSITVAASARNALGWVRLSSVYGSYTSESEHEIPAGTIAAFSCPFCRSDLLSPGSNCPECEAPMSMLGTQGGGVIEFCSRKGCKGHALEVRDTYSGSGKVASGMK